MVSDIRVAAAELAETLEAAHALLCEHIADEEKRGFPVVDQYVSLEDWARIETAAKRGGNLKFEVPRVLRHATEPEPVRLMQQAGLVIRLLLKVLVRGFDKREAILELGLHRATDLIGGFRAWQAAGLPVVPGGTPCRPLAPSPSRSKRSCRISSARLA